MVRSRAPFDNLPLQPTALIGRDHELRELTAAFRRTRLLTLVGVGGVGKTRLALALAERIAGSYTAGTWFVDLARLPTRRWWLRPWQASSVYRSRPRRTRSPAWSTTSARARH